jgi:hypothetical protein
MTAFVRIWVEIRERSCPLLASGADNATVAESQQHALMLLTSQLVFRSILQYVGYGSSNGDAPAMVMADRITAVDECLEVASSIEVLLHLFLYHDTPTTGR